MGRELRPGKGSPSRGRGCQGAGSGSPEREKGHRVAGSSSLPWVLTDPLTLAPLERGSLTPKNGTFKVFINWS